MLRPGQRCRYEQVISLKPVGIRRVFLFHSKRGVLLQYLLVTLPVTCASTDLFVVVYFRSQLVLPKSGATELKYCFLSTLGMQSFDRK